MARRYVLDASVLMRAFLPDREWSGEAQAVLALLVSGDLFAVAPRCLVYEFCYAIVKAFLKHEKTEEAAREAIQRFLQLPIQYVETREMVEEAAGLSFKYRKRFYDMCYFSIGRREGIAVCTADEKCVGGVGSGFPSYVLLRNVLKEPG